MDAATPLHAILPPLGHPPQLSNTWVRAPSCRPTPRLRFPKFPCTPFASCERACKNAFPAQFVYDGYRKPTTPTHTQARSNAIGRSHPPVSRPRRPRAARASFWGAWPCASNRRKSSAGRRALRASARASNPRHASGTARLTPSPPHSHAQHCYGSYPKISAPLYALSREHCVCYHFLRRL